MVDLKILYVASEIDPFLETTAIAGVVHELAKNMRAQEIDVRVLVPRFGVINERRNRIHEVVRMAGINIKISQEIYPLIIKVSSIREERLQVYFIDNDELFKKKAIFADKEGNFLPNNDERVIFFCKSALAAIEKLEWQPDIVHCHGWMTALIPYYLKTSHKDHEAFAHAKSILTLYDDAFAGTLRQDNFAQEGITATPDFAGLIACGKQHADLVTKTCEDLPAPHTELGAGVECIPHDEALVAAYVQRYEQLHQK